MFLELSFEYFVVQYLEHSLVYILWTVVFSPIFYLSVMGLMDCWAKVIN
ncbi:hypothetical protein ACVIAJ_08600 [Acinetobacter johnsonii]